jgi:hypothetical protein
LTSNLSILLDTVFLMIWKRDRDSRDHLCPHKNDRQLYFLSKSSHLSILMGTQMDASVTATFPYQKKRCNQTLKYKVISTWKFNISTWY